jgi:hypothetical protein
MLNVRYDTVDAEGIWHGAALIVSAYTSSSAQRISQTSLQAADYGSYYEPHPTLRYSWTTRNQNARPSHQPSESATTFELPPHPADPYSTSILVDALPKENGGSTHNSDESPGQELYVYGGNGG